METIQKAFQSQRSTLYVFLGMLLTFGFVLANRQSLHAVFGEANYTTIHLIIEVLIVVFSFAIAIQVWLSAKYQPHSTVLNVGALFMSVGFLELVHALSYKGMPFFIQAGGTYTATWFYIISRLTLVIGLLLVYMRKIKDVKPSRRYYSYAISLLYTAVIIVVVYYPEQLLPNLVTAEGTTVLKNNLQFLAVILQIAFIFVLLKRLEQMPRRSILMVVSSFYLIASDILFSSYKDVYDMLNFTGHIFQLLGFGLLFKAIYYGQVERPFRELRNANQSLERSQEQIQNIINYDAMTGLPNEHYLLAHLKEHLQKDLERKAVIVFGVERYNTVRQSIGSKHANRLLQLVAQRLQAYLPYEYVLCKLAEDRFAIFVKRHDDSGKIYEMSQRLQKMMEEPFEMGHFSITTQLHIGVSMYPKDATSCEDLLQTAQFAAFEAEKEAEHIAFYQVSMQESRTSKMVLEQDLKRAIQAGELFLEYQPQLDLRTGEIRSVEALIRWQHPERGLISPFHFIPLAEESGLIIPIGQWVLETACRETVAWQKLHGKPMKVAVNLSMGQLYEKDLVRFVEQTLRTTGLRPQDLQLEITESMTMNTKQIIPVLHELKKLQVTIAVDDFGTGYSSLSYLKDFPIDCLKIDRSFIHNILTNHNDEALVRMILSMARHLQLKVVAEGIETMEQLHYLKAAKCDKIQGYYISKPVPFDVLLEGFENIASYADEQFKQLTLI